MKVILTPLHEDIDREIQAARRNNRTVSRIELTKEEKQVLAHELDPIRPLGDFREPLSKAHPTWNTYKGIPVVEVKSAS